jgi:hypothetical protein
MVLKRIRVTQNAVYATVLLLVFLYSCFLFVVRKVSVNITIIRQYTYIYIYIYTNILILI